MAHLVARVLVVYAVAALAVGILAQIERHANHRVHLTRDKHCRGQLDVVECERARLVVAARIAKHQKVADVQLGHEAVFEYEITAVTRSAAHVREVNRGFLARTLGSALFDVVVNIEYGQSFGEAEPLERGMHRVVYVVDEPLVVVAHTLGLQVLLMLQEASLVAVEDRLFGGGSGELFSFGLTHIEGSLGDDIHAQSVRSGRVERAQFGYDLERFILMFAEVGELGRRKEFVKSAVDLARHVLEQRHALPGAREAAADVENVHHVVAFGAGVVEERACTSYRLGDVRMGLLTKANVEADPD